ncbi:MAG: threonine--tRNA ligase, partial [Treponema sp.]|nr:threonine--tRNA ligase [Treponema sp.]
NKIKTITKEHKTPYILVVGENEKKEGTVAVRFRDGRDQQVMKLADFVAYVKDKVDSHFIGI